MLTSEKSSSLGTAIIGIACRAYFKHMSSEEPRRLIFDLGRVDLASLPAGQGCSKELYPITDLEEPVASSVNGMDAH